MNHIVDMINIEMFNIDDYSISRDDRHGLVDLDHVSIHDSRDVYLSGIS